MFSKQYDQKHREQVRDYCRRHAKKFLNEHFTVTGDLMPIIEALCWQALLYEPSLPELIRPHALASLLAAGHDERAARKLLPDVVASVEAELDSRERGARPKRKNTMQRTRSSNVKPMRSK
jgi:hypothetical protein